MLASPKQTRQGHFLVSVAYTFLPEIRNTFWGLPQRDRNLLLTCFLDVREIGFLKVSKSLKVDSIFATYLKCCAFCYKTIRLLQCEQEKQSDCTYSIACIQLNFT